MKEQIKGSCSICFENPPYIERSSCIAGEKEGQGPLGNMIEEISNDPLFGKNTWEEAESAMQLMAVKNLLKKALIPPSEIRYIFAGDLLGQLIGTTFGLMELNIPLFGLYGACSTMGEAMALASMTVAGGYAKRTIALASSHYAGAEKQFRFPLEYGNQRPLSATWTVTGCGAVLIGTKQSNARITGITTGKLVDFGVKDSMNMGACMAPAACDLILSNFKDFNVDETYYDMIITGDLGKVGKTILLQMLSDKGYDIEKRYTDCGLEMYNEKSQDTHAGGSGCGCAAVTLCAYILKKIENKIWNRVLFIPTGAMLSTVSFNEGKSVPGIAHGIVIESV